jgi:tetratricopeptide (TPR) repeat protein
MPSDPAIPAEKRPSALRRRPRRRLALALVAATLAIAAVPVAWREIDPEALRRAEAAYRRGDLATALRLARGHLAARPQNRAASLIAARSLSRLDQPDAAEPLYRRAGTLGLEDLHVRAIGIVRANRREQAIGAYTEILAEHPDDVLALRRLAAVRISQTQYVEAMELADRLKALPDGRVIGHTLSGLIFHRTGYAEQAVADFRRVLALDPELRQMPLEPAWQFWAFFAEDLLHLGRAAEARTHLARAIRTIPDARLAGLLGRACHQEGDAIAAEDAWRQATRWDPRLAGPWLELGRLALTRDRPVEAIEPLERAASLSPGSPEPPYSLSLAHRRLGHAEEAARFAVRADELRRRSRAPRGGMGPPPSPPK